MADAKPRHRGRVLRVLLIIVAVIVLVPLAGLAIFAVTFDPDSAKPRIEQAVKRATGRELALNGRLGLKWSLWPTIEARDVALANVPGGSRPQMVTLGRLEAQVALLPLLSRQVEIDRLILVHPDILLETDAQGRPNWRFVPEAPSQKPPGPTTSQPAAPLALTVQDFEAEDGTVTYRDGRTGHTTSLDLKRLTAQTKSADAPVTLSAEAAYGGTPFRLDGDIGPLARLRDPAATTPWPVRLTLAAAGAKLAVDGALTQPIQGRGYKGKLAASVPDLAALAPFLPRANLPPLRDVRLAAEVADTGGKLPQVSALAAHAGASDLGALVAGLKLARLDLTAPAMDQPLKLAGEGTVGATPVTLAGSLGAPELLIPGGKTGVYSIDMSASAGDARVSAKGRVADPRALSGVDLSLSAQVPDLASLSPLAHRPLPALHNVGFQGRLSDGQGGLAKEAVLRDAKLTLPRADLAGDATIGYGGRPSLRATLAAQRIDADSLMSALAGPTPGPAQGTAAPPPPPDAATRPPAPAPARESSGKIFSDRPLPFAALRDADADLHLKIGTLHTGGVDYRDIAGHLTLAAGRLNVDPIGGQLPAGRFEGRLSADAGQANPPVSLVLRGPGLQLGPLLVLLGLPAEARGNVDIDADLRGTGQSAHALAASADGHLGVALVNGEIDNRLLSSTLGQVLQHARLPDLTARPGTTPVRCFALRLDAKQGVADVRALLLDTSLFYLEGNGSLNLGDETMALRLRPLARLGGTGVIVPLSVRGPFRNPKVEVDATRAASEAAGIAAQASRNPQLGVIIGALGGDRMVRGAGADDCARDLAVARGGRVGTVPAAAPAPPAAEKPKAPKPADLLRQLLR